MTLSGITHASHKIQHNREAHAHAHAHAQSQAQAQAQIQAHVQPDGPPADVPMMQGEMERDWTALGVLAEVSRHFDLNEKHDGPPTNGQATGTGSQAAERFEMQEQFVADDASASRDLAGEKQGRQAAFQQQLDLGVHS